jgi:hypothetical protein
MDTREPQFQSDRLGRLRELAGAFRNAIERADREKLPCTLQEFPRGSCGEAALLLGTFLKNQCMGSFQYVCGWRDGHSHAWLEGDGIIVDITADFFPDKSDKIIVTHRSPWHEMFERKVDQHEADFHLYDSRTVSQCEETYNIITERIRLPGTGAG